MYQIFLLYNLYYVKYKILDSTSTKGTGQLKSMETVNSKTIIYNYPKLKINNRE